MLAAIREGSLRAVLAQIPDPRRPQGRRHPHTVMLTAVVCGILSGVRGGDAIAQWVRSLEVAKDNDWGYTRILGELKKLGIQSISRNTVKRILIDSGLDPGPKRG